MLDLVKKTLMFRLLFAPFFLTVLFACDHSSKKTDPLFYQISKADSVKHSKDLHSLMKKELKAYQEEQLEIRNSIICWMPPPRRENEVFLIRCRTDGLNLISNHGVSSNITQSFVDRFLKNRNTDYLDLDKTEMENSIYPFYTTQTLWDYRKRRQDRSNDLNKIKATEGADPALIEYYEQRCNLSKETLKLMLLLHVDSISVLSHSPHVEIDCPNSEAEYNRVSNLIVDGFYHLRNYECLRYFKETYLSLYARTKRLNRELDKKRLKLLELLHPIRVIDYEDFHGGVPPIVEIDN